MGWEQRPEADFSYEEGVLVWQAESQGSNIQNPKCKYTALTNHWQGRMMSLLKLN